MATNFNAGDIVKLKSGGPAMTVERVIGDCSGDGEASYSCSWFAGAKDNRKVFAEAALKLAATDDS